jgi:general secretion pathway protein G
VSEKVRKFLRGEQGFTLVEMMVVLVIIAVLIAGGITYYLGYISRAKITKADGDIATIQASLESYYAQNQAYPTTSADLTAAGCSATMVTLGIITGVPYVYSVDGTGANYCVATAVTVDPTKDYVAGTGTNGTSSAAVLVLVPTVP